MKKFFNLCRTYHSQIQIAGAIAIIVLIVLVVAAQSKELRPGDFGYKHDELHQYYQQYFSDNLQRTIGEAQAPDGVKKKAELGDDGYGTDDKDLDLPDKYQKVFDTGKCNCATGECRPTEIRATIPTPDNPRGVLFKINRQWCPPTKNTYFLEKTEVPPELLVFPAHICAGDPLANQRCPVVECARVNSND